jgi:hypothetical protein
MHRKILLTAAAPLAALAIAAPVYASGQISNVFNNHPPTGWTPPTLSTSCQRGAVTINFGATTKTVKTGTIEAFAITDAELKCVTMHLVKVGKCAEQPIPPITENADHGMGKPGDWSGLDQWRTADLRLRACVVRSLGVN